MTGKKTQKGKRRSMTSSACVWRYVYCDLKYQNTLQFFFDLPYWSAHTNTQLYKIKYLCPFISILFLFLFICHSIKWQGKNFKFFFYQITKNSIFYFFSFRFLFSYFLFITKQSLSSYRLICDKLRLSRGKCVGVGPLG